MEHNKGTVKAVSKDNHAVLLNYEGKESWVKLGENVKINFVRKGNCEFSFMEGEDESFISYLRMIKENTDEPFNKFEKPSFTKPENAFKSDNKVLNEAIKRMSAIKASSLLFGSTGKVEEMKNFTEEVIKFIEVGKWKEE
jgi:hypothetical protein